MNTNNATSLMIWSETELLQRRRGDCSPDQHLKEEQTCLWLSDPLALYGVENAKLAPGYRAPATSTTRK